MTREELLARLAGLRQASAGHKRVPHKPLLLLWLFGQFAATSTSAVTYEQAEAPVSDLINDFGPPVASPAAARQRAAMPFVHLERELWDLRDTDGRELGPDSPERRGWLLRRGAAGRLRPEVERPDYYQSFMRAAPAVGSGEEIERKVTVRTTRQERLTSDDPPAYWAILNEAVIRRVVGGADVMRAQLEHVAEMARLPHVNVQVLPFKAGAHPAMDGSFRILGFPEASDPDVVYLENQVGGLYLEEARQVERYTLMFSHLIAKALDPDESRRLIASVAQELT